ncbi:hypothetical protein [Clavibacter sp. CFBP 8614]|uniref:hypothetical protein n=1 Tax=unclassified Clavibacter TaxID=2626594 RepID=UPI004041DC13
MLENTNYAHLGVLLLVIVALVPAVIAMVATVRSRDLATVVKLLWLLLLTVPLLGIVLWLGVRPTRSTTAGGHGDTH